MRRNLRFTEDQLGAMRGGVDIQSAIAEFVGYIRGDKDAQAILFEYLIGRFGFLLEAYFEAIPRIVRIIRALDT